ncbi:MAG: hypothetical protein ACPH7H_02875 [Porticoccaceae bacterium]
MKNQIHNQTDIETETKHHDCIKIQRQNIPSKWRGNTLVPVIIALAISALATIAFLTQGANLAMENKVVIAQNEIAAMMSEWNIATQNTPRPADDDVFNANNTTYGLNINYTQATDDDAATIAYTTDSVAACTELRSRIPANLEGINATTCNDAENDDSAVLTITLN